MLPHWIDSKFADGSKTKLDVRYISTHKLTPIRGSLIQFTNDLVFSPPRDEESCDLSRIHRVSLSRANILSSTTTLYALPRDRSV